MEDAHAAVLNLDGNDEQNAFFAVYDGHGGTCFSQEFKTDSSHALDRQVALSQSLLVSISTNVSPPKMRIARSDLMKP